MTKQLQDITYQIIWLPLAAVSGHFVQHGCKPFITTGVKNAGSKLRQRKMGNSTKQY